MKKRQLKSVFAMFLLAGGVLAGCGNAEKTETTEKKEETKVEEKQEEQQPAETEQAEEQVNVQTFIDAYKAIKAETEKAKEGQPVDWNLVEKTYVEQLHQ